jgi:hypothetical protein
MGSLRIQETYRIDPNDLRNLPPGVAWITTAGRAAKVAVTRGGQAPVPDVPRTETSSGDHEGDSLRGRRHCRLVGRGNSGLERAGPTGDHTEEISLVEARLIPATTYGAGEAEPGGRQRPVPAAEQRTLPINQPAGEPTTPDLAEPDSPTGETDVTGKEFGGPHVAPGRGVSPYAHDLAEPQDQ